VSLSDILALVEALKEMPNKVPEFPVAIADEFKHLIPAVAAAPPYDARPIPIQSLPTDRSALTRWSIPCQHQRGYCETHNPPLLLCAPHRPKQVTMEEEEEDATDETGT
jgi:hypothetical protein